MSLKETDRQGEEQSQEEQAQMIAELQDKVDSLAKENAIIKAQFEQACHMTKLIKEKNDQMMNTADENLKLKKQNEDLLHQIALLEEQNSNAVKKQNDEKEQTNKLRKSTDEAHTQEITDLQEKYDKVIKELKDTIDDLRDKNDEYAVIVKSCKSKEENLLKSASYYFLKDFNSFAELSEQFKVISEQLNMGSNNTPNPSPVKKSTQIEEDEQTKKIQKLRKRAKEATNTAEEAQKQINELKRSNIEKDKKLEILTKDLGNAQKRAKENEELIKAENDRHVTILENRISQLTDDLNRSISQQQQQSSLLFPTSPRSLTANVTAVSPSSIIDTPKRSSSFAKVTSNDKSDKEQKKRDAAFDQVTARNSELARQLADANRKRDEVGRQLQCAEQERVKLEVDSERQKSDLGALKALHEEAVAQLEAVRTALKNITPSEKRQDQKKDKIRRSAKIAELERSAEVQAKQLHEAQLEVEHSKAELKQLQKEIEQLKVTNEELKSCNAKTEEALADAQDKLSNKKDITEEDLIPMSAWRFSKFDSKLAKYIEGIGANEALQTESKLKTAFAAIAEYYDAKYESLLQYSTDTSNELDNFQRIIDTFVVDLTIAQNDSAESLNTFLEDNGQSIINQTKELRSERDDLKRRFETLQNRVSQAINRMGFNESEDFNQQVDAKIAEHETLKNKLAKSKKQRKELRNAVSGTIKTLENIKAESDLNSHAKDTEIESLKHDLEQAQSEVSLLKKKNATLNQELAEHEERQRSLEMSMKEENAQSMAMAQSQMEALDQTLREEISTAEAKLEQTTTELEETEAEVDRLKNAVVLQKRHIKDLETEVAEQKVKHFKEIQALKEKCENEKSAIKESSENAISEMKAVSEKQRDDFATVSESLAASQKKVASLEKALLTLKREKKKTDEELRIRGEEADRAKVLMEGAVESARLEVAAAHKQELIDLEAKKNTEKRELAMHIARELAPFFDAGSTITDRAVINATSRARNELDRLMKADRQIRTMTRAKDRQTTEDAVAQMLL